MKKFLKYSTIAVLVIFVVSLFGLQRVRSKYSDSIYDDISLIPKTRVALVLGAGLKKNNEPSDALADRVKTAVDLYKNGKVEKILMSGDNGQVFYNEVMAMKKLAVSLGIPEKDITLDYAGFRTYDSCYRARDIFSLQEIIIVTQAFHLARALFTCNEMGIRSAGMIADKHIYIKAKWWRIREIAAQMAAFWQVEVFRSKPKFLGEKEEI